MFFFFFFVAFNYYILRILKDTYIITKSNAGAEVLPFLKVYAILPSSIFFTFLLTFLAKYYNRQKLFNIFLSIFIGFFALFFLVIFPNQEHLHLHSVANYMQAHLPDRLQGLVEIVRYWSLSLFYVMAETWSTIMVSIIMWGFANEVIQVFEAKRFYALFSVATNISGIGASLLSMYILNKQFEPNKTAYFYFGLVLISAVISFVLFKYLNTKIFSNFLSQKTYSQIAELTNKKKYKMSFLNALKYLLKSKYLLSIAGLLFAYNLINNLCEFLMKAQAKDAYSDFSNFGAFTSNITLYTCILASFFSYFLSGNFLRKFGWRFTALITPVALLAAVCFFFFFLFAKYSYFPLFVLSALGSSPGLLVILFGSIQNILARSCKFTFFDDTKEMTYIPLPAANKLKGKAAIDGIVSRLGKSGSSIIIQSSVFLFASVPQSLPYFVFFIIVSFVVWGFSIRYLSKRFVSKTAAQTISKLQTTSAVAETESSVEDNILI